MSDGETLLIIDGHSVAFRAFYALPVETFHTSSGQTTNAVYGFVSMLVKMLEDQEPTHIAVAFDVSRHSFRTDIYPDYKGTRAQTPPEFEGQVPLIQEVLRAMGITVITKDGYEGDDILATLAARGERAGWRVYVASGDRDSFQLIDDRVTVLYPGQGASDVRVMTPQAVEQRYGVPPERYPDIAALVGETADNLPGVPGVGPKTAAQWVNKYDGLAGVVAHAGEVGGKRGQALREHLDDVRRNRRLNKLLTDLDVQVDIHDLRRRPTDRVALEEVFDALEFRTLRRRVLALEPPERAEGGGAQTDGEEPARPLDVRVLGAGTDVAEWFAARASRELGLWVAGSGKPAAGEVDELAVSDGAAALVVDPTELSVDQDRALAHELAADGRFVVHDGKAVWHALRGQGWRAGRPTFDVELAAYLCRPEQRSLDMDSLANRYLGRELPASDALFEMGDEDAGGEVGAGERRAAALARTLLDLTPPLGAELDGQGNRTLLTDIELPVQRVLARMEDAGVAIDSEVLAEIRAGLAHQVSEAADDAYGAIGRRVNLSSPKQLQDILFGELSMPKTRRTKTGYTTNAEALADLYARTQHPFLEALLRHRDKIKLLQMVDSLTATIAPDHRIHTTFQQTVAATGRLASSDPNLQNIPARTDEGVRIRDAFVAGQGYQELLSADYSQIEMRIMAHLSQDAGLIAAFNSGEDLHRTMAAMVFGVAPEDVDHELRTRIKRTSYGLAYGLSAFGLSRQLGIPVAEANELREKYFERFGGIRDYLDGVVERARRDGYTETMFGRRRYLPDLTSGNRQRREMAERAALNAPIQGSAADIIKIAMVHVGRRLREEGLGSRLLLQIHDELVLEVAPGESERVEALVRGAMASPVHLEVPLDVAVGRGHSWRDAAH